MEKISIKHVREMRGTTEQVLFINVLPKKEYIKGHIPDSINIPLSNQEDFVQRVEKIVPTKNLKIVVYCASENCSASETAAKLLDEQGFSSVMDFSGGLLEWAESGEKVEAGKHALIR